MFEEAQRVNPKGRYHAQYAARRGVSSDFHGSAHKPSGQTSSVLKAACLA